MRACARCLALPGRIAARPVCCPGPSDRSHDGSEMGFLLAHTAGAKDTDGNNVAAFLDDDVAGMGRRVAELGKVVSIRALS